MTVRKEIPLANIRSYGMFPLLARKPLSFKLMYDAFIRRLRTNECLNICEGELSCKCR